MLLLGKTARTIRAAAIAIVLGLLATLPPELVDRGPTICPFRRFLGIECFGCGMTRAICHALHGDLSGALALNRLVVIALAVLLGLLIWGAIGLLRGIRELRAALLWVWLVVSVATSTAVIAPWIVPAETIARVTPICEWKARYNRECVLCGMTTAFLLIPRGNYQAAERANRGSIPLYLVMMLNSVAASLLLPNLLQGGFTCKSPVSSSGF